MSSDLERRRDRLARQLVDLQWDLGGLAYEMAIRDHFRLDVLNAQAAKLQQVDAELAEVERMLKLDQAAAAGACPTCGALYAQGAVFCWQCGKDLMPRSAPRGGRLAVIRRLLDSLAPVRPAGAERGYRRLLRWAALPVTDRRWAAPLAAVALGFGLFVGVALGPGAASTVATGVSQIVEEVPPAADGGEGGDEIAEADGESTGAESSGDFEEEGGFEETESSLGETGFEFEEAEPEFEGEPFAEAAPNPPAEPEEEQDGEEEGQTVSAAGTVVHVNPAAGSYTLVETGGTLVAVHAPKLPKAGTRLSVPVRTLANGTFAEAGAPKKTGSKARASFNGIVTYVDPDSAAPAYSVSKRGVSVLVSVRPDPAGAVPALPAVGAYAVVTAEIEALPAPPTAAAAEAPAAEPAPGAVPLPATPAPLCDGVPLAPPSAPQPVARLWQAELDAEGVPFTYSDFAGIVTAVCPQEGRLYLSADDLRAGEADIAFTVPRGIRTDRLRPGDSVTATATIEADGTLKLTGLAGDERTKGADDPKATQGDLVDHNAE